MKMEVEVEVVVEVEKKVKNQMMELENSSKLLPTLNLYNTLNPVMIEKKILEKVGKKFQELLELNSIELLIEDYLMEWLLVKLPPHQKKQLPPLKKENLIKEIKEDSENSEDEWIS